MNKIVGALWTKEKDGMEYYSGVLQDFRGDINIAVFPNHRKQAENQPDYNIVISFNSPKKEAPQEVKTRRKKKDESAPF